jgi:hypothetical protein
MKGLIRKFNAFLKGIVYWLRPGVWLGFLIQPLRFSANLLSLSRWIAKQQGKGLLNDFYTLKRDHSKRYRLYEAVAAKFNLAEVPMDYYEFGVSAAHSFKWWLSFNHHPESKFYGFDTFEGLPEDWGTYRKGEMAQPIQSIADGRHTFIKGLFQETLFPFIQSQQLRSGRRKVIHCDADLFSSTLFILTSLAPHLKAGDVIFFDEFNVPDHEYFAYKLFTESFYLHLEFLGAVNNYYQVAFVVT